LRESEENPEEGVYIFCQNSIILKKLSKWILKNKIVIWYPSAKSEKVVPYTCTIDELMGSLMTPKSAGRQSPYAKKEDKYLLHIHK